MATHVIVVIPAYNEARAIVEVIRGLKQCGFTRPIVVDDGSRDGTGELASREGVIRPHHIPNRGLGAALGTGISAALRLGAADLIHDELANAALHGSFLRSPVRVPVLTAGRHNTPPHPSLPPETYTTPYSM
jgi:glycosyltransferase involved in cell wall biosynthesis